MEEFFSRYLTPAILSVIKAALFLILGLAAASIVSKLLKKLAGKLQEKLVKKTGNEETRELLKDFVGKLSFLLIFLLFVPSICQALGLAEMSPMPIVPISAIFMSLAAKTALSLFRPTIA